MMEPRTWIALIAGALMIAAVGGAFYRFLTLVLRTVQNEHAPRHMERATVRDKHMADDMVEAGISGSMSYFGTFETESGLVLELRVGRSGYGSIQPGDRGLLHWSGDMMELFEKDEA